MGKQHMNDALPGLICGTVEKSLNIFLVLAILIFKIIYPGLFYIPETMLNAWTIFFLFFYFLSFCHFLGCSCGIWRFPGWGWIRAASTGLCHSHSNAGPSRVVSAAYTTARSNTGSLTHWAKPRIKPTTSWFLVGFFNHWATTGTPYLTECI